MEIPIFPQAVVSDLYKQVKSNLHRYTATSDSFSLHSKCKKLNDTKVPENLSELMCYGENKETPGHLDALNSIVLFKKLEGITPYQARDERIWSAISHIFLTKYALVRHKIQDKDKLTQVQTRFFARGGGHRSIERNNAASRLWWSGYFVNRCREDNDFEELTHLLLTDTDFRSAVIERPEMARIPQVGLAILLCKKRLLEETPTTTFFSGRDNPPYRQWFKHINMAGGSKLYAAITSLELFDLFWGYLDGINSRL